MKTRAKIFAALATMVTLVSVVITGVLYKRAKIKRKLDEKKEQQEKLSEEKNQQEKLNREKKQQKYNYSYLDPQVIYENLILESLDKSLSYNDRLLTCEQLMEKCDWEPAIQSDENISMVITGPFSSLELNISQLSQVSQLDQSHKASWYIGDWSVKILSLEDCGNYNGFKVRLKLTRYYDVDEFDIPDSFSTIIYIVCSYDTINLEEKRENQENKIIKTKTKINDNENIMYDRFLRNVNNSYLNDIDIVPDSNISFLLFEKVGTIFNNNIAAAKKIIDDTCQFPKDIRNVIISYINLLLPLFPPP